MRTEEYVKVANGDKELIANVVHQMRGYRTLPQYSMDCGYAGRMLPRITATDYVKDRISDRMIENVYEHRDPDSDVQEEGLMAANGCIKISFVEALQRRMARNGIHPENKVLDITEAIQDLCPAPEPVRRKNLRGRKPSWIPDDDTKDILREAEQCLTDQEKEADRYVSFLWDLAKFSFTLDQEECNALKHHTHSLSEDLFFCTMLHKYCELVEYDEAKDMEALRKYFNGEHVQVPVWADESKLYFDVLYDMLFVFEPNKLNN